MREIPWSGPEGHNQIVLDAWDLAVTMARHCIAGRDGHDLAVGIDIPDDTGPERVHSMVFHDGLFVLAGFDPIYTDDDSITLVAQHAASYTSHRTDEGEGSCPDGNGSPGPIRKTLARLTASMLLLIAVRVMELGTGRPGPARPGNSRASATARPRASATSRS